MLADLHSGLIKIIESHHMKRFWLVRFDSFQRKTDGSFGGSYLFSLSLKGSGWINVKKCKVNLKTNSSRVQFQPFEKIVHLGRKNNHEVYFWINQYWLLVRNRKIFILPECYWNIRMFATLGITETFVDGYLMRHILQTKESLTIWFTLWFY